MSQEARYRFGLSRTDFFSLRAEVQQALKRHPARFYAQVFQDWRAFLDDDEREYARQFLTLALESDLRIK